MALVFSKVNGEDYAMAPDKISFCVEWVQGIRRGRRGLAWLTSRPETDDANAKQNFEKLKVAEKQNLFSRFDAWIDGLARKKYFHGWDEKDYKVCFVFKYQAIRIFGFLCHPLPDKRFEMCVLSTLVVKHEWLADTAEKKRMKRLSENLAIRKAAANPAESCEKVKTTRKIKPKDRRGHERK
jgi:hypothetical protein